MGMHKDDAGGAIWLERLPANVVTAGAPAIEMEQALEVINARLAREPLTAEEVFLFPALMSSDTLDSYFTRMADSSLQNYVVDAQHPSVPLMNSHRTGGWSGAAELAVGRSFWAVLDGDKRLYVYHYMLRNWRVNDVDTDDLIRGIQAGVHRDTSIGFAPGKYRCSVCGNDMRDWNVCPHLPGRTYDGELCYAWVEDAHLVEDSLVYKGANPDAVIVRKAREALERGVASPADIRHIEDAYQVRIAPARGFLVPAHEEREATPAAHVAQEETAALAEEVSRVDVEELRTAFATVKGVAEAGDAEAITAAVRGAMDAWDGERAGLEERIRGLEARAAMGDAYVADMVEQAVQGRVRAQGTEFNADLYRAALADRADLAYIKAEIDAWDKQARRQFAPGRQVPAGGETPAAPKDRYPADVYRA